jgi:GTP-sensing pleiotropic transcriptional regulator CodY
MKSILDRCTRDELITRIQVLDEESLARWDKMNVFQMMRHCVRCEELYLGKRKHKRVLIGRIFGKAGLKSILNEGNEFPKGAPTSQAFKVKETAGNLELEKERWIALIEQYGSFPESYVHWFFGKMTREQVGCFVYRHNDHHLRQFGT